MLSDKFDFIDQLREQNCSWATITEKYIDKFDEEINPEALRKRFRREAAYRKSLSNDLVGEAIKLLRKGPTKPTELARKFGLDIEGLETLMDDLLHTRAAIRFSNGYLVFDKSAPSPDYLVHNLDQYFKGDEITFGLISDTHLCSIHDMPEALISFYDMCAKANVQAVLHGGDFFAGNGTVYKGQYQELKIIGEERQLEYAASVYPEAKFPTFAISGNHDCLDKFTEVLTKRGWVSWEEIKEDDKVLGINTETQLSEWQDIQCIIKKSSTEIYNFESETIEMGVTENHRHLHYTKYAFRYTKTKDIGGILNIPIASITSNKEYDISDEDLKTLYKTRKYDLPDWLYDLSARQMQVFINTIVDLNTNENTYLYVEKTVLEILQPIFIMCGFSCIREYTDKKGWRLNISNLPTEQLQNKNIRKNKYSGFVYCLTVPLGNFLVRKNGKPYFTGNCDFYKAAGIDILKNFSVMRPDIHNLGKMSATLEFQGLRILLHHGEGGLGLARSYKAQRVIDHMNQPFDLAVIGHWHIFEYMPDYKGTTVILPGCFERQSLYLKRKGLVPNIGGVILKLKLGTDDTGKRIILRQLPEFINFTPFVK